MKKKYVCPHCDLCFEDESTIDQFGWHVTCPKCGGSFDTDEFDKRFVIAIADDWNNKYEELWDDFNPAQTKAIYAFGTIKELIAKMEVLIDEPPSTWWWVVDAYHKSAPYCGEVWTILSGVIDWYDIEFVKTYERTEL